jgi:hypothetical protein
MAKGSRPRPYSVSQKDFGSNYDAIFRKQPVAEAPVVVEDAALVEVEPKSQVNESDKTSWDK